MLRIVGAAPRTAISAILVILLATPAIAGDPLISLGQKLFSDPMLSSSGQTACASCHDPRFGYAQPQQAAASDNGVVGKRNVPSLLDVRTFPSLMWDGRFPTLERQVFGPFTTGEMGMPIHQAARRLHDDPDYMRLFGAAFGDRPTPEGIARAIAAFERTLVSDISRVDRFLINGDSRALAPIERHGLDIFLYRAKCVSCHQLFPGNANGRGARPLFSDFQYHNIGIGFPSDPGRFAVTNNPVQIGAFRTPSLRNAAITPPYMHDGSLGSLEEVVEFYNAGGNPNPYLSPRVRPLNLSEREKAALVALLNAMSR